MDDYLFSMCLAEGIVKCVLNSHGIKWKAKCSIRLMCKEKIPKTDVTLSWEEAILSFIEHHEKLLKNVLKDYTDNNNSPTVRDFCFYTIEIASEVFKSGYDPAKFIKFSAMVAELAYRLFDHCQDIPEHAVGVIGTVLISQIMTGEFEDFDRQEGLKTASINIIQMNKKDNNSPKYKTTSF